MKRNWETIREILSKLEDLPDTDSEIDLETFSEDRAGEISYHVELLIEAGLIEGERYELIGSGPADFCARRLTWSGHEFLDSVRNDTVWAKTKKTFAAKGLEMTFDLVKSIASEIAVTLIRGTTGI